MYDRSLPGLIAACIVVCCPLAPTPSAAQTRPALTTREASPTAGEVLRTLKAGNRRYATDQPLHPHSDPRRRRETAFEQHPIATIIACSDSRVPVEQIFDAGIGDLFVIRVAGNICDTDEIASIEYGTEHLHTPLVVVLGHTSCGAVTAAATHAKVHGNIAALVHHIDPAVEKAQREHPELHDQAFVECAVRENVLQSMADLLRGSPDVRDLIRAGKVQVIGAVYHLDSGEVEWLGPHPRQRELLRTSASPQTRPAHTMSR
jgi:carbonic anhydrase